MGRKCCITVGNKNKRAFEASPLRTFLAIFLFFIPWNSKERDGQDGILFRKRGEALEKNKRVGCVELHEGE